MSSFRGASPLPFSEKSLLFVLQTNSLRYSTASSADGANRNAGRAPKINEVEADLLLMWLEHERPRWHKAAAEAFKEIDVERWQQATDMAAVAPPPSPAPSCDTLTQADGASSYNPNYIYPRGHRFRQPTEVLEERKLHAHWEQRPPAVDARLYLHPEMDPAVFHQPPAAQSIRPTWSNFFAGSSTAGICSEWRVRSPLSELDAEAPVGPL